MNENIYAVLLFYKLISIVQTSDPLSYVEDKYGFEVRGKVRHQL